MRLAWMRATDDGSSKRVSHCWLVRALLVILLVGSEPVLAQTSQSGSGQFQARIDEAARALQTLPRLKHFSQRQVQEAAEFVAGNMLFVLLHEMGHAVITEMQLPVLGREEDAADSFAIINMLNVGNAFSHRVLVEAGVGLYLNDLRDKKQGIKLAFYDEHGLNKQRAYQIVCLMVGSDPDKFKDIAEETKLPQSRQDSCQGDYGNASWSWAKVLEPYRRTSEQPKQNIEVVYGEGEGKLAVYAQVSRSIRLLETIAEHAADQLVWRAPFTLEIESCGESDAQWQFRIHKLTLCYELAAEFAELYRDYRKYWKRATHIPRAVKGRKTVK
jgi:hypothetical protein